MINLRYLGIWLCLEDKPKKFNFKKLNKLVFFFFLQNDKCVHKIKILHLIVDDREILMHFDFYILLVDRVISTFNRKFSFSVMTQKSNDPYEMNERFFLSCYSLTYIFM